jgi:hypothetical protein
MLTPGFVWQKIAEYLNAKGWGMREIVRTR